MDTGEKLSRAALTILTHCLSLPAGAQYLIFTDETSHRIATILANTGLAHCLHPIVLFYDSSMQQMLQDSPLSSSLQSVIADSSAAFICLNGDPENFLFRDHIRRIAWNSGLKVAHMPGINQRILRLADLDYQKLHDRCEMFALALAKGSQLKIITHDKSGKAYKLTVPLKPWDRFPIISDGIIEAGVWGNVPSGETYIAPPEDLAWGDLVLNGSIHKFLIPAGEEIRLHFENGRLVNWFPEDGQAAHYLKNSIIEFARKGGDENWSNLAEVGLGTNPLIRKLTGNPLLDEKKYGSVHIALGDNMDMGGTIESKVHCDMICLAAEVSVDGKAIIRGDKIVLREQDWRENFQNIDLPDGWSLDLHIRCTAVDSYIDAQGRLKRFWNTSSGRVCSVFVGDERTSLLAGAIYQSLQKNGHRETIRGLARQNPFIDENDTLRITYLLYLYGLVSLDKHNEA